MSGSFLIKKSRTKSCRNRRAHARQVERENTRKPTSIHTYGGAPEAHVIREIAHQICYATAELGGHIASVSRGGSIYIAFADRDMGYVRVANHCSRVINDLRGQVITCHTSEPYRQETDTGLMLPTFGPAHVDHLVADILATANAHREV